MSWFISNGPSEVKKSANAQNEDAFYDVEDRSAQDASWGKVFQEYANNSVRLYHKITLKIKGKRCFVYFWKVVICVVIQKVSY